MSSILKALKKLENQAPQPKQGQSWPQIDTKGTIRKQAKGRLFFGKSVSILIIVIIAGAGGWFAFSQKSPLWNFFSAEDTAEKKADVRASLVKTEADSIEPAEKKIPGPDLSQEKVAALEDHKDAEQMQKKGQGAVTKRKDKPENSENFPKEKVAASKPPQKRVVSLKDRKDVAQKREKTLAATKTKSEPQKSASLSKKKVSKADVPQKKKPVSLEKKEKPRQAKKQAPLPAVKAKTGSEKKTSAPPEDIASQIDMLQEHVGKMRDMVETPEQSAKLDLLEKEVALWKKKHASGELTRDTSSGDSTRTKPKQGSGTKLKIQAIVWSSNPKDRMAVVNDQIIRIGGSVDGVVVTGIGADYILVKEGKEEWEVKFQIK